LPKTRAGSTHINAVNVMSLLPCLKALAFCSCFHATGSFNKLSNPIGRTAPAEADFGHESNCTRHIKSGFADGAFEARPEGSRGALTIGGPA
jgi:hypothetical protein